MKVYSLGELVCEIFWEADGTMQGPFVSGAPAITIDTLSRLGVPCGFLATVGNDDFGHLALSRLERDGVDIRGVRVLKNASTGLAFTRYAPDGSRRFIYYYQNEAPAQFDKSDITETRLSDMTWLHISGNVLMFSESSRQAVEHAARLAKKQNATISFDPNVRLEMMSPADIRERFLPILKIVDVFFPSRGEIEGIFPGVCASSALDTFFGWGGVAVLEKRGKDGCRVYKPDETFDIAGLDVCEVDPTGCGDSFCAGYIAAKLRGYDDHAAARFANAVGAITATKKGAMEGARDINEVLTFGGFRNG